MTIDICIPCYRNLPCLRLAAKGIYAHIEKASLGRILLHVQEKDELADSMDCFEKSEVVSTGGAPENMCDILNRLVSFTTAEWILCMEQDTFLRGHTHRLVGVLDEMGFVAGGPVDTMHYSNPNAQHHQLYGEHGRLSPQPGFFHSSMILIRRSALVGVQNPFTVREPTKMHGYGVLGGESYYGLRENLGVHKSKLAFFTQIHIAYGYAAAISWMGIGWATHLYYSGTKRGYRDSGFITEAEHNWLVSEEERFLSDYERSLLG